jgi:60S ribosomal protein uL30
MTLSDFTSSSFYKYLSVIVIARLKALDAYVAYGFVSHQTASDLLHRRAFTEFGGGRRVLSDNTIIEQALGDKNILCLNDLLHEVFTVGPNFTNALSLLCPFRLSSPVGHFEKTILDMHDKVEEKGGFLCGDEMDVFLRKIL